MTNSTESESDADDSSSQIDDLSVPVATTNTTDSLVVDKVATSDSMTVTNK